MLGAAILAWVAGIIRDHAGDYAVAYIMAGVLAVMAGVAALTMRRRGPTPELAAAGTIATWSVTDPGPGHGLTVPGRRTRAPARRRRERFQVPPSAIRPMAGPARS